MALLEPIAATAGEPEEEALEAQGHRGCLRPNVHDWMPGYAVVATLARVAKPNHNVLQSAT